MSYPDLVREFVHGAMAKHAAELAEAANDSHVKALLERGYRFQTEVIVPERFDDDTKTVRIEAKLVPPSPIIHQDCPYPNGCESVGCLAGSSSRQVWVLAYRSERDEADNGVLGVYATEELARAAGIEEARKDPNIAGRAVKWEGERLFYRYTDDWYEVRPDHYVQEWHVKGL